MRSRIFVGLVAGAVLLPSAALAHTGHGETAGFVHGFAHPVGGLDHVLAMVLVGILASQIGGRALYAVPTSFVLLMAVGGALGMSGVAVPFVEAGIALSIILFGAAVAARITAPIAAASALVGLFAIFHGHAHGAEMPENLDGFSYGAGFLLATAMLHAGGIFFGSASAKADRGFGSLPVRFAGAAAAIAGVALFAA